METGSTPSTAGSTATAAPLISSQQPSSVPNATLVMKPQINGLPSHDSTGASQVGSPYAAQTNGVPIHNGKVSATSTTLVGQYNHSVHKLVGPAGVHQTSTHRTPNHEAPVSGIPQVGPPSGMQLNGVPIQHAAISGSPYGGRHSGAGAALSSIAQAAAFGAMVANMQQQPNQPITNPHLATYLNMASTSMAHSGAAGHIGGIAGGVGHGGDVLYALPPGIVGVNDVNHDIARMSEEGVQETVSEEVFSSFKSSISIPGAQIHPGDIVEAASLSDVPLPDATYDLAAAIPADMITSGKLSNLQLEGVLYACQRHQRVLPDGNRAGFFIGDAAGVGKGRQISAIVLDNYARGRTKHIWFSISSDLKVDAQRDMKDLGCHIKIIEGCQHLDKETRIFGLPADFSQGVIFSTYATLVSSVSKGSGWNNKRRSRLDQLIKWCGGDKFDGCLIFDECHKAKHFIPGKENSSTKVAVAVTSIQRMLPNARVVYCSATGVTDVKNMAFMERLGLWGSGAPFKSFDHFLQAVNRRGLGVAEMLAMEMKASGMYVSRGLSFRQAEFITIETQLTPKQAKMYDVAAHVWNELRKSLESAIERSNTTTTRVWASFWGCHQRFFKQLCLGVKVPAIVKEAKEALADGYSVVIGLQTTGEASLDSEMLKADNRLTEFVSNAREILLRFINQHFPTQLFVGRDVPLKDDEWCVQAKQLLMGFAKKIELPNSPLDEIIDQLGGTSAVAEMTGRRGRMVRVGGPKSQVQYELRSADNNDVGIESLNVKERNSFMEGRKLIAVISDAASTGISLHADTRVANQRRRVHLTIELPWSADKAVQQMGRSHRSNQSSGPMYRLLTTNLGGERRFAAAVARRLESLGALTQGDRRAASGADLSQFNFDTNYGRSALRSMYSAICNRTMVAGVELSKLTQGKMDFADFNTSMQECLVLMGVLESGLTSLKVSEKDEGKVSKFLNRILGISVKKQNMIFNYFFECLQAAISTAKKEGKFSEGLVDIKASSVEMLGQPKRVFLDAKTSTPTYHMSISVDRGMTWEQAVERMSVHNGTRDGFYKSKREQFGKHLYLLATQKPNSTHYFRIARPNTGISAFDEEISELLSRYNPVPKEKAEKCWKEQYDACKTKCIHGRHCKNPKSCTIGSRCYRMDLLSGGIVTLMATLESAIARCAGKMQLSKASYSMKVVRVELSDGDKTIGVRYPAELLDAAEDVLKENKAIEAVQSRLNIGANNGLSLLTTPVTSDPVNHAKIDPETPVNPKLVNKAMTAPKTMHSFFKTISKSERQAQVEAEHAKRESTKSFLESVSPRSSQLKNQRTKKDTPRAFQVKSAKGHASEDEDTDDEPMIISESSDDSGSSTCKSPSLMVSSNLFKSKSSCEKQGKTLSPLEKRKSTSPLEKRKSTSPLEKRKSTSPLEKRKALSEKRKSKTPRGKQGKSKSPDKQTDESTDEDWCPDDDFENKGSSSTHASSRRRGLRSKPRKDYAVDKDDSGSETPIGKGKLTRKCKTCKKAKTVCACKTNAVDLSEVTECNADENEKILENDSSVLDKASPEASDDDIFITTSSIVNLPKDCAQSNKTLSSSANKKDSSGKKDTESATKVSDNDLSGTSSSRPANSNTSSNPSDLKSSADASDNRSSSQSSDSTSSTKDQTNETLQKSAGGVPSTKSKESDSSSTEVVSRKRPLAESNSKISNWFTQPAKKTKQCSIASSFAKVTEAKQKKVVCPVCDNELPPGTSNEQMNVHVDKCLKG